MLLLFFQNITESKYHYQPSWVMIIIAISVMILGYLFSAFNTRFNSFLKASLTLRFGNPLSGEDYSLSHPTSILLSINFIFSISLFILQTVTSKNIFQSMVGFSFVSYLLIIGFVFTVYVFKILFLKIIGHVFDKLAVSNEYVYIIFLVNQLMGIGFIPITIFIAYGNQLFINTFVYVGILFFVAAFIIRVGKGAISVFSEREIPAFYLFLYICTLEILPLLLGVKLFEKFV